MKKEVSIFLAMLLILGALSGISHGESKKKKKQKQRKKIAAAAVISSSHKGPAAKKSAKPEKVIDKDCSHAVNMAAQRQCEKSAPMRKKAWESCYQEKYDSCMNDLRFTYRFQDEQGYYNAQSRCRDHARGNCGTKPK